MKKILPTVRSLVISVTAFVFILNTVSGQVATLQDWSNEYHGTSQTQQNIDYTVPTGSNANRMLVVAIASARNAAGPISVILTYGGQSLTPANGDMGASTMQHTALYYLNEAGLDAATDAILSVTVSGGIIRMTDVWAAVFDYVNQTLPITDSKTSTTGTSSLSPGEEISFVPPLNINSYNQALEIISSHNSLKNNPCNINYATDWTMIDEQIAAYSIGFSYFSIKNGVANRTIPVSDITDPSPTSFDKTTRVSMTSLSLNYEIPPPPTIQASNIFFTDVTTSSFTINWTPGDGTHRLVLVKAGSAVDSDPVDGTTYTASNLFGAGDEIGTGNFVVYNGSGNSVTVDNLNANTTYHVAVYEFSGPPGLEDYLILNPARGSQLTSPETAVTDDYRSNGSGNWSDAGIWQTFDGSSWVTAGTPPNSSSGVITIRNGHTITVDANVTADQVVIVAGAQVTVSAGMIWTIADGAEAVDCNISGALHNSGTVTATGNLTFNSGSTYRHIRDGGTIPSATWDANSTCLISGIAATGPTGFGQSFGNFTWNCPSQTVAAAMNSDVTIKGNFRIISTGSGSLAIIDNNTSRTVTLTGNFFQSAGSFVFNNGLTSTATANLYVAGNFSFTGGSITELSNGRGAIFFNGNGAMQLFTSGGSWSYTIDFTVSGGAYLQMGTGLYPSVISLSTGSFTLSAGATLGITDQYGITASTTGPLGGNIRVSGTRTFSTEANYIYNGAITQNTGNGLPSTVYSLVFNNTVGAVNFNSARTITNSFSITTGSKTNLGNGLLHTAGFLLLEGIAQPSGSYGGATSGADNIIPEYFNASTGILNNSPPNGTWLGNTTDWDEDSNWVGGVPEPAGNAIISSFAPNQPVISVSTIATCNILTLNTGSSLDIAGTAVITSAVNNGTVTINPGGTATITTLTNTGTLNLESDASGMFSLMLDNYSGATGTVNAGIYFTGGQAGAGMWRWHYLAVPFQQNKSVLTNINPVDLMNYLEPSAVNDMWEGWQWHDGYDGTTAFNNLLVTEGYNFYNDQNVNVTFSGNSLMTSLPVKNLSFTVFGWNLFGNSLTCGIDWDNVTLTGDMNTAVHFLKDYQEYYYIQGGPGVPAGTTGHIPPLQGFFVQAHAPGASINFAGAREHNDIPFYKGDSENHETKGFLPLIRLALENGRHTDETVIWFNEDATMDFDNKFDAHKYLSKDLRSQIYSVSKGREYAINGIPSPSTSVSIPLAIRVPEDGTYTINQISVENMGNYTFYLKDLTQNFTIDLNSIRKYSFSASKGTIKDRFILIINNLSSGISENPDSDKPFNVYSSFGYLNIEPMSDMWDGRQGSIKVTDLTGRTLIDSRNMEFNKSSLIQLPVRDNKGVLIIEISSAQMRHTARVVIK